MIYNVFFFVFVLIRYKNTHSTTTRKKSSVINTFDLLLIIKLFFIIVFAFVAASENIYRWSKSQINDKLQTKEYIPLSN